MTTDPVTLDADASVSDALARAERHDHSAFPVLDGGRFAGLVTRARLRRTLAEASGERLVRELLDAADGAHVRPEDPLVLAAVRMRSADTRQLAVLDRSGRLVGLITTGDVVNAHARAALDADTSAALRHDAQSS
jgi:CBS domain-containing protein